VSHTQQLKPPGPQPPSPAPSQARPEPRPRPRTRRPGAQELLGFATAGLLAYAADLALFLWLRGPVGLDPLTAKALSFVAGCSVAYAGNALGTYRHTTRDTTRDATRDATRDTTRRGTTWRTSRSLRRYGIFFGVNLAGALVQLLCILVSHYGLGFTSPRADTVSGAGIGMMLATVLRFWGTRTLVFRGEGRVGSWTG